MEELSLEEIMKYHRDHPSLKAEEVIEKALSGEILEQKEQDT